MNRCKTCRFFGEPHEHWIDNEDPVTDFHICDYVKQLADYQSDDLSASAYAIDGSGYYARLVVKDDFGCINWDAA